MRLLSFSICLLIGFLFIHCTKTERLTSSSSDPYVDNIERLTGAITYLETPPPSVELHALVDDSTIFMFAEKMNHRLRGNLAIDLSSPGDYFPDSVPEEEQTWEAMLPDEIPAGTVVSSFYLHYDNETYDDSFNLQNYINCIGQYRVKGSITFKQPILGVVMRAGVARQAHLRQSDRELGLASVNYCEHYLRHFPGINIADGCQSDRFILSEDRKTLYVTNNTDIHHDNYRIIVAASR